MELRGVVLADSLRLAAASARCLSRARWFRTAFAPTKLMMATVAAMAMAKVMARWGPG